MEEVFDYAGRMALDEQVKYIVVDTEAPGVVTFGLASRLAAALGAEYFKIDDLKSDSLVSLVKAFQ